MILMNKTDLITSPHRHDGSSVSSVMFKVCAALVPGVICYAWFFGVGVLIQCILSICFALIIESLLLKARKKDILFYLKDGSVIVTALIFALMITPYAPWWISLIGLSFGLTFAKHIYGGLGHNLFNPAATAYIFVLLCFPVAMNYWPSPVTVIETSAVAVDIIFSGSDASITRSDTEFTGDNGIDSISAATPLADMQSRLASMAMVSEIRTNPIYGQFAGTGWEWINLAYLIGGITLLIMGLIGWHIPVAVMGSMFIISLVFNLYDPEVYASALFHLFSGGTVLGAFFVATDPVTASTTPKGRIIFGCIIGILAYIIRIWGAYPDGIAFAVLIANGFVPLIDRYSRPKVIGEH